jgi:hypothetical protein
MRVLFALAAVVAAVVSLNAAMGEEPVIEAQPGVAVVAVEPAEQLPFKVKAQYWRSDGNASFKDIGFDPAFGPWESEVEYPLDGNYYLFGAEYSFLAGRSRFAVDVNYGFSEDIDGTTKDWDWLWSDPEPLVFAETDADADSDLFNANVYYRLWGWGPRNSVDVFVGYHNQKHSFTNSNARILIPDLFSASGKVAEYEMEFNGVRAGLRTEMAISPRFSVMANLAFLPFVDVDTNGKWLLRDLTFSQNADGYGVDFDLLLEFMITRNVSLVGGLKYVFLRATEGEESGSEAGVPYGPFDVVDEIESDQFGGTAGVNVRF